MSFLPQKDPRRALRHGQLTAQSRVTLQAKPGKRKASCIRIKEADWPVVMAFQDLQRAWLLQQNQGEEVSLRTAQQFERNSWDRLLRYLINQPLCRE
jgi:hypothetical protein